MQLWTKAAIRRVIWSRKQERWLERMRLLNIPVHTCDVCSRQVTSSHRCVPTGLAVPEDTLRGRRGCGLRLPKFLQELLHKCLQ